ncbi:tubulin-specific chaperone E [Lentithecium fluviatile CBS 122367]|uniref:Tubulin-specific chaperone E n=1 Tax=Lentithecium fluviatile CBS 122367 TaxID=1168545 RepID=A0A6G1JLU2_9PLEO|nr:tubulin-specific chaperone E [Lentithecium fluviatile CBS 122367]
MTDFYVGKRLSFDGHLCTVRYYGEVKGTKGEWLGVEWDDPSRGKHSGENGGIRYFECLSKQPTAASFIRPTRTPDPPRSFVEALKTKYASEDFEDPDVRIVFNSQPGDNAAKRKDPLAKLNQPIRISGKEVEEVGFDKIRKQLAELSELKIVILDGLCMERPSARLKEGGLGWEEGLTDVKDACPKAVELDLSRNLFEEWREVASICEQLEKLRSLRIDGNRFRDTALEESETPRARKAFANIKYFKLESTLLPWKDLTRLTHLFPSLTTLVASSNLHSTLSAHTPNNLITDLSLEENLLTTLSSLKPLTSLPHLRRLILKSNNISAATPPSSPTPMTPVFSTTLSEVDLSYNEINSWFLIDTLQHVFPGLTSLRISHNPLFANLQAADGKPLTPEDGYMLTLARLANLQILNYSPITAKERLNAESYYLSLVAREVSYAPESEQERILDSHPRYKWLCEEYGKPHIVRLSGQVNPNSLAARLLRIKLYQSGSKSNTIDIEIPMGFTAYTLLGMASEHFGIKPRKCRLVWETGDWMPAPRAEEVGDEDEEWDDESDEEAEEEERPALNSVMREVEILPGTRSVGTWIEGKEATVRVEVK